MKQGISCRAAAFIALTVSLIAITGQSLWIDEGTSAFKAIQPDLHTWWQTLRADGSSNLQLPLHFFFLWGWEKIMGDSEIALRAANAPFLVLAFIALAWGLESRPRLQFWCVIVTAINAFVWYYMNEARPYIMVFSGCCITFACLARAHFSRTSCLQDRRWLLVLLAGCTLVSATSSISVPWAMASLFVCAWVVGPKAFAQLIRNNWIWSSAFLLILSALALYYMWAVSLGAAPTPGRTGILNLFFVAYEHLGFAGLGPGRLELRQGNLKSFAPYFPILITAVVATSPLLWQVMSSFVKSGNKREIIFETVALIVFPALCVLFAAKVGHARLWGRHFTPLLPFILFGLAFGISGILDRAMSLGKTAIGAFLLAQSLSCLEIRFASRHQKDDYRDAATLAKQAISENRFVWWAADDATAFYYHLPQTGDGARLWHKLQCPLTLHLPEPGMIIISKPDIFDNVGLIAHFAQENNYRLTHRFQAFEIWER